MNSPAALLTSHTAEKLFNKYKLPLLAVIGVTALNTTFYVAFGFMSSEFTEDDTWMLRQLKDLYIFLDIPLPTVIITDREKALIASLWIVFPGINNLLCIWHIQKNVFKHCKPQFVTEEDWTSFQQAFNNIIYSTTRQEYEEAWNSMQNTYNLTHPETVQYIMDEWLYYKKKFVKFWTNQITHFGNNTTSRSEGGHRTLKRSLQFFTGNDILYVIC